MVIDGASSSFPLAIPTASQMIWSRSIWIMPIPRAAPRMARLRTICPRHLKSTGPHHLLPSQAHHRFTAEEMGLGLHPLQRASQARCPHRWAKPPIIENDCADVTAYVRVLKDPTGVLWHNFINYDSKKETGYVGLKKPGRHLLHELAPPVPLLHTLLPQSRLPNTHRGRHSVRERSAGAPARLLPAPDIRSARRHQRAHKVLWWKSLDSFLQHDVQEFNRVLQEKLETR